MVSPWCFHGKRHSEAVCYCLILCRNPGLLWWSPIQYKPGLRPCLTSRSDKIQLAWPIQIDSSYSNQIKDRSKISVLFNVLPDVSSLSGLYNPASAAALFSTVINRKEEDCVIVMVTKGFVAQCLSRWSSPYRGTLHQMFKI